MIISLVLDCCSTGPFQDGYCHLAGVTACLRVAHVFERRTLALPGLLGCIGIGVVDNIVLFGPKVSCAITQALMQNWWETLTIFRKRCFILYLNESGVEEVC